MPIQSRAELQQKLEALMSNQGPVYYQPPSDIYMKYPCIIYTIKERNIIHADDLPFLTTPIYDLQYIYKEPDEGSEFMKKLISSFSGIRYDRAWKADNLYHENVVIW